MWDSIMQFFKKNELPGEILKLFLMIVLVLVLLPLIFRLLNKISERMGGKNKKLNYRALGNAIRFVIIFVAVQWVMMSSVLTRSLGQTIFQGTAVLTAIAGFAAQNVLADILCGLMISVTKPFDIGNRISLESGITGIVKDLTLRHVVLQGIDTQMYVIPNSRINSQQITNLSWHSEKRSVDFRFQVSYDSDPDQARAVIRKAIMESPLSVPGKPGEKGEEYAEVYFLSMEEYSLLMGTTAYYLPGTPTEVFKTDINTRVKKALSASGIEIPYRYLNVQMKG